MSGPPSAIPAAVPLARQVSFFSSVRSKRCNRNPTAAELLAEIRDGFWRVRIEAVRAAARTDKKTADNLKRKLPAITWSGVFERRGNAFLQRHAGLLCLDFDKLGTQLADARQKLVADEHVLAAFTSPSGTGLKVLVPVDAHDASTHRQCFFSAEAHFAKLNLTTDEKCKDVVRLCFVSHDPDLFIRQGGVAAAFTPSPSICTNLHPLHVSAPSASLCTTAVVNLERRATVQGELASDPYLARIYRQFIEKRTALPGKRNLFITQMVPAVYEVVSESLVLRFSLTFYDLNRALFKDDRVQHEAETKAMLENYRASYRAKLSPGELAVYGLLDGNERGLTAFRIMRDLAKRGKGNVFFLSCDELGARIGCDSRQAHRLLCAFNSDGLIEVITPGVRRAPGAQAKATEYRWKL